MRRQIQVYTVCLGLSVQIPGVIAVDLKYFAAILHRDIVIDRTLPRQHLKTFNMGTIFKRGLFASRESKPFLLMGREANIPMSLLFPLEFVLIKMIRSIWVLAHKNTCNMLYTNRPV